MHKIFDSKVTPFGGIHLIHKELLSTGVTQFIDDQLGKRSPNAEFKYSDLILSRIYTCFCGGSATEDVNYIRENTLDHLKAISIPSADTISRGDKELAVECDEIETSGGSCHKINVNTKLNRFLIASAIKYNQLNKNDNELIYDFDNQFIPAEKYDANYSYKKQKGYFPGVATVGNIPVYFEGRNGNCNVKTGLSRIIGG